MCGIVGVVSSVSDDTASNRNDAVQALVHRGPDSSGMRTLEIGNALVWLGHTRLRIIDLSRDADQPMASDNGHVWATYNGELYDHADHRARLSRVRSFRTNSDTEVLIRLYEEAQGDPDALLSRLRGMFAFALVDLAHGQVLLARDRLGIKPLVYTEGAGSLSFASEVRALRALGCANSYMDSAAATSYLRWGVVPGGLSTASNVRVLPPGSYLLWKEGRSVVRRYWAPAAGDTADAGELAEALEDSVRRHTVADRPVGVFLSSGLDSRVVATLAARHGELRTLTVTFPERDEDEGPQAAATAAALGAQHTEVPITGAEVNAHLPQILEAMDTPTHDGVNSWLVCRAARDAGLVVALSGLGGDEIFGGYPSFRTLPTVARLAPLWTSFAPISARVARAVARRHPGAPVARLLSARRELGSLYAAVRTLLSEADLNGLPQVADPQSPNVSDVRDAAALLELTRYLPDQLLRDTDQMSMSHSLEVRVPLLDNRLVEAALAMPAVDRLRVGKEALATAAQVHKQVPKRSFALPFEKWLRGPLRQVLKEGLLSDTLPLSDLVPSLLRLRLWDAFERAHTHWSRPWAVSVLRLWAAHHGVSSARP